MERNPMVMDSETIHAMIDSMKGANPPAPAFSLVRCIFKNNYFVPFSMWGNVLVEISRKSGNFAAFLPVFEESCRVALDEKLEFIKPDVAACNAALEGCCCELESVNDAERVVGTMSNLDVRLDELTFGFLGYLSATKGLHEKINELEVFMG